jgi:hypothetical protein
MKPGDHDCYANIDHSDPDEPVCAWAGCGEWFRKCDDCGEWIKHGAGDVAEGIKTTRGGRDQWLCNECLYARAESAQGIGAYEYWGIKGWDA